MVFECFSEKIVLKIFTVAFFLMIVGNLFQARIVLGKNYSYSWMFGIVGVYLFMFLVAYVC